MKRKSSYYIVTGAFVASFLCNTVDFAATPMWQWKCLFAFFATLSIIGFRLVISLYDLATRPSNGILDMKR